LIWQVCSKRISNSTAEQNIRYSTLASAKYFFEPTNVFFYGIEIDLFIYFLYIGKKANIFL
jgi:hypothetical protein